MTEFTQPENNECDDLDQGDKMRYFTFKIHVKHNSSFILQRNHLESWSSFTSMNLNDHFVCTKTGFDNIFSSITHFRIGEKGTQSFSYKFRKDNLLLLYVHPWCIFRLTLYEVDILFGISRTFLCKFYDPK